MLGLFEEISKEEDCELRLTYGASYSKLITFSPFYDENKGKKIKSFQLLLDYRGQQIRVENKVGDVHMGLIECKMLSRNKLRAFKIKNQTGLKRLINRENGGLSISCEDKKTKDYIQSKLIEFGLEDIAKESQFEPLIIGLAKDKFELSTAYSLQFSKKREVIRPLIKLYKSLVDYEMN